VITKYITLRTQSQVLCESGVILTLGNKCTQAIGSSVYVGYVFDTMKPRPPPPALDWCLFLDVDGTLLELTDTPSQTIADPDIKLLLGEVSERLGGAVALVSGRKIETLDMLFAPLQLPAAGLHGVERRTIAVHFRLAPQFEETLRRSIIDIAKPLGSNYHIQSGKMLFEIKPRGFNKATALQAFMKEPPFSGRLPVFVGDDLTDQDGFAMVEAHGGMSVGVGDRVQGQYYLENVDSVRNWLKGIAALHDSHHA
jgi:trehalose 6-phosphate phosphatase